MDSSNAPVRNRPLRAAGKRRVGNGQKARRSERNPEQSISKILAAATKAFASAGYSGARVDEIAADAAVSKNLIYHYFGSKEQLYISVLELIFDRMRTYQDNLRINMKSADRGMKQLVGKTFDYFADTPEIISLMNTENLLKGQYIKSSTRVCSQYESIISRLSLLLNRGAEKGIFRSDVDPINLYISISALAYFYLSNQWTLSFIFKRNLAESALMKQRRSHMIDMIMSYLSARDEVAPSERADTSEEILVQ